MAIAQPSMGHTDFRVNQVPAVHIMQIDHPLAWDMLLN
jgi:hypothetical protein